MISFGVDHTYQPITWHRHLWQIEPNRSALVVSLKRMKDLKYKVHGE